MAIYFMRPSGMNVWISQLKYVLAEMYRLDGAEYSEVSASPAFPSLTADTLTALLVQLQTKPRQAILEGNRQSLRARPR